MVSFLFVSKGTSNSIIKNNSHLYFFCNLRLLSINFFMIKVKKMRALVKINANEMRSLTSSLETQITKMIFYKAINI